MRRFPVIVRLVAIFATYALAFIGLVAAMIEGMHYKSAASVIGAQYYAGLFLVPNTLGFAASAWIMRSRWVGFWIGQAVAAGLSLGLLTLILFAAFTLTVTQFHTFAITEIGGRVAMLAPGIIAAQCFRLRARDNAVPSAIR